MSETVDPIIPLRHAATGSRAVQDNARSQTSRIPERVTFNRIELTTILGVYGLKVADGEWRDYAIDFHRDKAIFSIFRRSSEVPLYTVEKNPKLARKQGIYSVIAQGGLILRRGHDLAQVLKVLNKKPKLSTV